MQAKPESVHAAHILQKHTESRNPNDSYRNVITFIHSFIHSFIPLLVIEDFLETNHSLENGS